jgi:hypothetical protein
MAVPPKPGVQVSRSRGRSRPRHACEPPGRAVLCVRVQPNSGRRSTSLSNMMLQCEAKAPTVSCRIRSIVGESFQTGLVLPRGRAAGNQVGLLDQCRVPLNRPPGGCKSLSRRERLLRAHRPDIRYRVTRWKVGALSPRKGAGVGRRPDKSDRPGANDDRTTGSTALVGRF